ncbi:MAG: HDOD domain-containing protein [Myxococcales bacterium]|nr:HDOD domain-containing protein [Myxococcales bacterium]
MHRVLFVDDEPEVLAAISRLLRRREPDWSCEFVHSGAAGLITLSKAAAGDQPFDVVVADMRMPHMDGPTFLTRVREAHPQMIRVVLSGAADLEANLRVIPIAHQFLQKPLELPLLREAVVRSCDLRDLLKNESLQRIVGEIETLPVRPGIYNELTEALSDPRTSMQSVGVIVEQDPGMSAKVLQMVNSAFFGTTVSVTSVQQAVTFLGLPQIRQLMLVLEVFESFVEPKDKKLRYFSMEYEREHALLTAKIARELVKPELADHAFTAGVLHDIGKLVLASHMTERFAECFHRCLLEDRPLEDIEREELGATHAEVGAYLLALWGLPDPVVEAVAFHHDPESVKHDEFDVISAVHVANYLADPRPMKPLYLRVIDIPYLERLGIAHKLESWRQRATEILRADVSDDNTDAN